MLRDINLLVAGILKPSDRDAGFAVMEIDGRGRLWAAVSLYRDVLADPEDIRLRPLHVLFLASDDLVAQIRLLPLLDVLSTSGLISYTVVDRDLRLHGRDGRSFDVCLAHRSLGKRQFGWLRDRDVPLLYDIDDFLLKDAADDPVRWCLGHAAAVTAPSSRLLATLDAATGGALTNRTVLLANAGRESEPPRRFNPEKPKLIWISSALPQSAHELAQVCRGIAEASEQMQTEIVLVGRFPQSIVDILPRVESIPWIEPGELLGWIGQRSLIAVAPLSNDLPKAAQLFADCKSDIKIAQYGSSGVAGVYSAAAPYVESDLPRRIVRQNDAASWTAEIVAAARAFPDEGLALARDVAFTRRRPSVLAAQLFEQLQRAAAGGRPFAFRAIATPRFARVIERGVRRWLR